MQNISKRRSSSKSITRHDTTRHDIALIHSLSLRYFNVSELAVLFFYKALVKDVNLMLKSSVDKVSVSSINEIFDYSIITSLRENSTTK